MSGEQDLSYIKKEIADYCEQVYKEPGLTSKQITDRLRPFIYRHLLKIAEDKNDVGISHENVTVGQHKEVHYRFEGIDYDLPKEQLEDTLLKAAHITSYRLREWKDAVLSLNLPHHQIERNLKRATKNLKPFFPDFEEKMHPGMTAKELQINWKKLYKNERRHKNRAAVLKALKDIQYLHYVYYLLQPVYVWARKIATSKDAEKRDRNVMNQIKVNPQFALRYAQETLEQAIKQPDKADKYELGIALAIATGRRRTEIFKSANLVVNKTTPNDHVIFSGQLKTKDRNLFGKGVQPYPIPCLVNRDLVLQGLKVLRNLQKEDKVTYLDVRGSEVRGCGVLDKPYDDQYHNTAVNNYYKHTANARIRQVFQTPLMEFRHSREMYSEMGYERFKKSGEGRSAYRTRVYGHAPGQTETGRSYETFELDTSVKTAEIHRSDDERVTAAQNKPVVDALRAETPKIEAYVRSPNAIKIHNWLIDQLEQGLPVNVVTPHYIRKHMILPDVKQMRLQAVKGYLGIGIDPKKRKGIDWEEIKLLALEEAPEQIEGEPDLDEEIDNIEVVAEEESEPELVDDSPAELPEKNKPEPSSKASEPVKEKPKLKAWRDGDNWQVDIQHGDCQLQLAISQQHASNQVEAMKRAWDKYQWGCSLPEKPKVEAVKHGGDWYASIKHQGLMVAESIGPGKKREHTQDVILRYHEIRSQYQKQ